MSTITLDTIGESVSDVADIASRVPTTIVEFTEAAAPAVGSAIGSAAGATANLRRDSSSRRWPYVVGAALVLAAIIGVVKYRGSRSSTDAEVAPVEAQARRSA